ncbi:hypothetical protein [Stenotrophomonas sp. NPDC077659]|uniref:hypothetical protein n=1 Tax=Stenotrophomonas sp. NPDC077659 TaxID=3390694 RepID=UPI003D0036F1
MFPLPPALLRPRLCTVVLSTPLLAMVQQQAPGVQAGITVGATAGAYAHYGDKPLVVPALAWQGKRLFAGAPGGAPPVWSPANGSAMRSRTA